MQALVFALALAAADHQAPSDRIMKLVQDSFKAQRDGQYLKSVAILEEPYEKGSEDDKNQLGDLLSQQYAYIEDQESSLRVIREIQGAPKQPVPVTYAIDGAQAEPALPAILREAKGRQVVILNEAHHMPRSRAFALLLARELRKEGFSYFAAETFNSKGLAEKWKAGYPTRDLGNYTSEPFFGDLARQAMKMGYKPIAYEADTFKRDGDVMDRINDREVKEANNLVERPFKKDPKARVFIYCGYSHATEDWAKLPDGREKAWMAARLKKLTGIDPLTIDQTGGMEEGGSNMETMAYRYADQKGLLTGDLVFRQKDGSYFVDGAGWKGNVDMQVFHPRTKMMNGRPDWTALDGYRKPVEIDKALQPATGRVLVQAFVSSEPDDAIPMDQVVVRAGAPMPVLMVPPGSYRLVVQDEAGQSRSIRTITVIQTMSRFGKRG